MYSGLGVVDYTPTGVRFTASPTCLFAQERDEANLICWAYMSEQSKPKTVLRGTGQVLYSQVQEKAAPAPVSPYMPPSSRFAGQLACQVKDLPLCPDEARCMDDATAWLVAGCIAKSYLHDEHRQWCEGGLGPLFYAREPYCTPESLPAVPDCLDAEAAAGRDYCRANGWEGPSAEKNALCWLAMHDEAWWSQYDNAPTCAELSVPPPPPQPPPVPPPPRTLTAPPEPERRAAATLGVFGILGLVAIGGAGYYVWQRRKK